MGAAYTTPADPPLNISGLDQKYDFIEENYPWPMVHIMVPFTIYYYFQSFWFTIFLVFINETIEGFFSLATDWNTTTEKRQDSVVGDPMNGFIGITLAHLLLLVIRWNKYAFPLILNGKSYLGIYVKYVVQIILIMGPIPIYSIYFYPANIFSIGSVVMPIWVPIITYACYKWNQNDVWFRKFTKTDDGRHSDETKGDASISYTRRKTQQKTKRTKEYYKAFAIFTVVFLLTFLYRWTTMYLQSVTHGVVAVLILAFIYAYQQNHPTKRKK